METVLHTKGTAQSALLSAILIAFMLLSSCERPAGRLELSDCEKFKTGVFHPKGEKSYIVERKATEQIETDLITGNKFFFEVTWLNACNYSLELVHTISRDSIPLSRDDLMQVEMISLSDSSYSYRLTHKEKYLEAELIMIDRD